jgi:uncharacterized membrane protein
MLSIRGPSTPIGRWRAPVFLAIGALHGVGLEVIVLHPWWGAAKAVVGPPVFDGVMLGLIAPALVLGEAVRRLVRQAPPIAAVAFAGASIFFVVGLVTEVRRLFHGPLLVIGDFGYAEVAAYAVTALVLALGLEAARARLAALFAADASVSISLTAPVCAGVALATGLYVETANPWWGPLAGDLHTPILLAALYLAGCGLTVAIALVARRAGREALARGALVAAAIDLFVLISLTIRYLFQGGAMRAPLREASLETWTFSAVWALYGLMVLAGGAARKDPPVRWLGLAILLGTTLKVFLFDMAHLQGVIRAASFLALGLVLLVGALAARRFGGAVGPRALN